MPFDLIEYYKIINGESDESSGVWHINYDKRHAYVVSSDLDATDGSNDERISLPPAPSKTEVIELFSDKLGQKLTNTKITTNEDGTEKIDLELGDRIVTLVVDQSGSMAWNDNNNFRHDIATDLINKIEINYPGKITYNLIEYGADIINVLFFGIVENDDFNPNDVSTLSTMIKSDDKANYDGMRVVRNDDHYPTSVLDGDIVVDGFISRIKDTGLTAGKTYYYTVYTFDKNFKFSEGIRIKVVPQERIIPRSLSNFRTVVSSDDLTKGIPFTGSGINRDANTIGIWHMNEGENKSLYDFSDSKAVLEYNKEDPTWYDSRFVPTGTSGLFFDGDVDKAEYLDANDAFEIDFNTSNAFTFMGWIYPYDLTTKQVIFGRSSSGEFNYSINISSSGNLSVEFDGEGEIEADNLTIEAYKWHHIAVVYDGGNPSGSQLVLYVNGVNQDLRIGKQSQTFSETHTISIANLKQTNTPYRGKVTEFSFHNVERSSTYINDQLILNSIFDENNVKVDEETVGIKGDNGDRLAVFQYNVPRDYNYVGGEVIVVKNEKNIPSWEEDGTVIYQESDPGAGEFFISDTDDFVLGETYYYRLFTKNNLDNISFLSDSPLLNVDIPKATTRDFFVALGGEIEPPESPIIGTLITSGNEKIYLRWKQNDTLDSRIERVKIFHSNTDYPAVNENGESSGELVFIGLVTDTKFVHRKLTNDKNSYYTIVNVDRYNRSSNYNADGAQASDFLHATAIPTSSADESTFPLVEVENIGYELVDENSVSIGWDQPQKSLEKIDSYFDQTVYIYGSITDEFGVPVSDDTSVNMTIISEITRADQADNVFGGDGFVEFDDIDAYDFFITRTPDGFFKGLLRMTTNTSIISQIKSAVFKIQLKSLLPKEGGHIPPNDKTVSGNPIVSYSQIIDGLISDIDGGPSEKESSENFYEYHSKTITVSFTNPWDIELLSRDNQKVYQTCYCEMEDKVTGMIELKDRTEDFNGVHMKATNPFVARAKIKYKGEPVESGDIQMIVWDADSSDLCKNACVEDADPYEGPKLQISTTVLAPETFLPIVQGTEDDGSGGTRAISFVDIPLYAPDLPQAVRLFVKGKKSGYSSVKDLYILFQSILKITIGSTKNDLKVDGKDIVEFTANSFIINPDYPNYQVAGSLDKSLVTRPKDLTVVQWNQRFIQTIDEAVELNSINLYSTDSVPVTNGVYSYTRGGTARNVFAGPVPRGDDIIEETREIKASIVYEGLTSFAKLFFLIGPYLPLEFDISSAKFLMEIDGGWGRDKLPNQVYGGGGWKNVVDYPLWADGIHYKKIKISRDPRTALDGNGSTSFAYADCFRTCATKDDNELLELGVGQVVEVGFQLGSESSDSEIEILHGQIEEREDEYTGIHYLYVGEEGFIENGRAFLELNDNDVTYFYVRVNKTVPESSKISIFGCNDLEETLVNDCVCLNGNTGITECDVPAWSHVINAEGKTTVFLNNNPLVLRGGGDISTGVPPCPIGLNEPLTMEVVENGRRVVDYYYSEEFGNPSNDFIYAIDTISDNDRFVEQGTGDEAVTLVKYTSDVYITVNIFWRGQSIPNGTPIYVSVGTNTSTSLFLAEKSVYPSIEKDGTSSITVKISARKYTDVTSSEDVEIFSTYDEVLKTERHIGKKFSLTLDKKDKDIGELPPPPPSLNPSSGEPILPPVVSPFSSTVHKYDILTDTWSRIADMKQGRGNAFSGSTSAGVYCIGGMLNNSLEISSINEKYSAGSWSEAASMTDGRFAGMSISINDDIYLIGGIMSTEDTGKSLAVTTRLEVYHSDVDMWEELENMPYLEEGTAFEEALGVAFGTAIHVMRNSRNYIYVLGGVSNVSLTGDSFSVGAYNQRVLRYSIEDDVWENSGILRSNELNTYERISPLSIEFDNKIIVFNGAMQYGEELIYPLEDFYINIEESFTTPASEEWINFGSGELGDFPVPKFQSPMVEYSTDPSTDHAHYYMFGGSNDESLSLDIVERIKARDSGFDYDSSYTITSPSVDLTPMPTGKHGASAELGSGTAEVYVMGGYTVSADESHVDITFDI